MKVTVTVPDELVADLGALQSDIPHILELGLRGWSARSGTTFEGVSDVLETLAGLPEPQAVLALRPSDRLQARISELLEKNRTEGLSADEEREWRQFEYVEHLVRMAKSRAALKLKEG